ncbi:unnamed protein product [Aspergillus oryzae RIB40]|uniref:DNA, SC001 n=1 Tax=Aspergillus oryzae (strain ATCC 42149 / RIB 40) TaxID=510516 RepID=Q2UMS0_ASPOR|nr:unnamed protein product [Aspergillus oryzae RIB40]BAE57145.1 unnamed protein product [Aspergillus oryzae RIB40]
MLDIQLSVMTGRPPHCSSDFCTTPHPVPFQEEEFLDDNVAQIIMDNESRNIFMEALSSRNSTKSTSEVTSSEGFGPPMSHHGKQYGQAAYNAVDSLTPNTSLYFLCLVDLGLIMRESIDTLYAPGAARKSWRERAKCLTSYPIRRNLHGSTMSHLGGRLGKNFARCRAG